MVDLEWVDKYCDSCIFAIQIFESLVDDKEGVCRKNPVRLNPDNLEGIYPKVYQNTPACSKWRRK